MKFFKNSFAAFLTELSSSAQSTQRILKKPLNGNIALLAGLQILESNTILADYHPHASSPTVRLF